MRNEELQNGLLPQLEQTMHVFGKKMNYTWREHTQHKMEGMKLVNFFYVGIGPPT